jgi:hypothetical protein
MNTVEIHTIPQSQWVAPARKIMGSGWMKREWNKRSVDTFFLDTVAPRTKEGAAAKNMTNLLSNPKGKRSIAIPSKYYTKDIAIILLVWRSLCQAFRRDSILPDLFPFTSICKFVVYFKKY